MSSRGSERQEVPKPPSQPNCHLHQGRDTVKREVNSTVRALP